MGASGDPADRSRAAGSAAAAVIAEAVLGVKGEVGMAGAVFVLDVGVILALLILIAKDDADRGAIGLALEDAGPDFRHVLLVAARDDAPDCPGRRRRRSGSKSSTPSGNPGGQPSMIAK